MDYFTRMFGSLFRSSTNRFKDRAAAQLRQNTVGKVQAKTMGAMAQLDKKVYSAADQLSGANKKGMPAGPGAGPKKSMPGAGPAQAAQGGNTGGGGNTAQGMGKQQQGTAKMGKGKRNKNQKTMTVTCTNCGSPLNADWDICPFCGTPVGQVGSAAPQPSMAGVPVPSQDESAKTMALDLNALGMTTQKRTVVGWIVAQNGNHRGEDFRIYDGKNILGTAADCDIVITDPFFSAKHCTIRHENGNFQVTDLDSMNGTFVNQKRCTKSDLIDNDTIRLGRTEFKFKSLF